MVKRDAKELSEHMVDSELEIFLKVHFSSRELHCLDLNWSWSCGQASCPRASHASWRLCHPQQLLSNAQLCFRSPLLWTLDAFISSGFQCPPPVRLSRNNKTPCSLSSTGGTQVFILYLYSKVFEIFIHYKKLGTFLNKLSHSSERVDLNVCRAIVIFH